MTPPTPEMILTAVVLNKVCPGWLSGAGLLRSLSGIEFQMLGLARITSTPLNTVAAMPLWRVLRYIKKLAKLNE